MKIPNHLAIIMDGNRRWAKEKGYSDVAEGHREGTNRLEEIAETAGNLGVKYLTVYAFSTENFKRSPAEVKSLFDLVVEFAIKKKQQLIDKGVKVQILGNLKLFPDVVFKAVNDLLESTSGQSKLTLSLCFGYGGRNEILEGCKKIIEKGIRSSELTEDLFGNTLYSANLPDVDLMIRTGGEQRISNFLLWKLAYAELYFTNTFWPDFTSEKLKEAFEEFGQRERRFGK